MARAFRTTARSPEHRQKIRRKLIQLAALIIYNADFSHWKTGGISRSPLKRLCVPGLNCYSCPGAVASCPLGALQGTLASGRFPFFVTGFLLLTGTLLGRTVCALLCPVGLAQELLYKIRTPKIKKTPKTLAVTRKISLAKYVLLAILCIALPLASYLMGGAGTPFFCKWICPAGTIEAGIPLAAASEYIRSALGTLFSWKVALAAMFLIQSVFLFRPFCRFICPLGAIYSFFNKIAVFGITVDEKKCTGCNACTARCKMDVLRINDRECIRCGECAARCPKSAITTKTPLTSLHKHTKN